MRNQVKPCALVYGLASRLTAKKKDEPARAKRKYFYASAKTISSYLSCDPGTVRRGIDALREIGFFEFKGVGPKGVNVFRVLTHEEWQRKHPGECGVFQRGSEFTFEEAEEMPEEGPIATVEQGSANKTEPSKKSERTSQPVARENQTRAYHPPSVEVSKRNAKQPGDVNTDLDISSESGVTALARELTYLSRDRVTFKGRDKPVLANLLKTYSQKELVSVFKTYLVDEDLEDLHTLKFIAQDFLDAADALAYSARKRKQDTEKEKAARDAAVKRMQDEAEAERKLAEKKKQEESYDPIFGPDS
jgi:hypothetical protein